MNRKKQLNEVARMQQLAGINEIKINNPLNLHPYVIDNAQLIKDSIDSFLENWDGININGTENPESSEGLLSYIQESLSNVGDDNNIYDDEDDNDTEFYENSLETFVNRHLKSLGINQVWRV